MGLLDDAIREHLELKRLRGADPGEVARQEQDALGSPLGEASSESGQALEEPEGSSGPSLGDHAINSASASQETVEINMEAELHAEADFEDEQATRRSTADTDDSGDSLEWEMPGERSAEQRDADRAEPDEHSPADRVEDVLEETPDFLRETPEQERLWFEQRPPRDFDFNE